jgi:Cdc6-like AAA superfamily ATPase
MSGFLLPELAAIGDTACKMLAHGEEEELLGESILAKVKGLIERKQVTSADVVRMALAADVLRVAEEAILADGTVTEAEVGYALPLVRDAAKRLSAFRAFYAHSEEIGPDGLRGFMSDHRGDKQLFGGACAETRWLGLEIVRRLAAETRDRDALDRYAELMMRLSEEIVSLGQNGAPAEQVRTKLEERLGLRRMLEHAQRTAPPAGEDPRIAAFCSNEAPDVFHAVEHANQVWLKDPFDVESVHQEPRRVFSRLLQRAKQQADSGTGRVLLVLGDAGSGKTHLMRAIRNEVHAQGAGYVGYMQLSGSPTDYARYVLASLIDSLEKPYAAPEVAQSGLMCLSDALLLAAHAITAEQRTQLQEAELSEDELSRLVYRMADQVRAEPGYADVDLDLTRALLFLQRREPAYHGRVIKYLRGQDLGRHDSALLGDLKSRGDEALKLIHELAKLIARVDGGALVLLLDQLEDVFNQPAAKELYVRLFDVVRHVLDNVPNSVIVIAGLRDFYKEARRHLAKPVLDRIERDPDTIELREHRSAEVTEALIGLRMKQFFEQQGLRHREEQPYFPIPREFIGSQSELRVRDLFRHLQQYQSACAVAGRVLAFAEYDSHRGDDEVVVPPVGDLTRKWDECLAQSKNRQIPTEDGEFLELFKWALSNAGDGVDRQVERDGDTLRTGVARSADALLVRLTNHTSRGGQLGKQIEQIRKDAKKEQRVPIVVRCSEFGGKAGAVLVQQLAKLAQEGGRRCVVDQATWRQMLAFKEFSAAHARDARFAEWVRQEHPLAQLEAVRSVLAIPLDGLGKKTIPPQRGSAPARALIDKSLTQQSGLKPHSDNDNTIELPVQPHAPLVSTLRIGTVVSVRQQSAELELQQLKQHAAFLGASGSGKTSLALNVIEQAVERGVGVVMLDRKGDLAVYADPRCWDAAEADPQRAQRFRALRAKVDVRLFTPGNPEGCSLRIRAVPPGLADLPAHARAQLAGFSAQALGSMVGYRGTPAEQQQLAILGKAIEVVGQLSRNEDPSLRDVIDLLADQDESLIAEIGHLDVKLMKKLVNNLEALRLNHSVLFESQDPLLSAEPLLGLDGSVPKGKVPITIISTKFLGGAKPIDFWVSQLLMELSRWCSRKPSDKLQALLFLDEADAYMPASTKPATKEPLQDLLKRARSAGLGVMLATQSPGDLDYKARDNIGTWWVGRIGSPTAIEKMKPLLSECRIDISSSLATSSTGEFFQISQGNAVRIRADRSLMDTVQLTEERILELARAARADKQAAAPTRVA